MSRLHYFLLGAFFAGVLLGSWWLVLGTGVLTLVIKRDYFVLSIGAVLDFWFATVGDSFFSIGFYTAIFVLTTVIAETVRKRLFWVS
jgi:hypothetical protein